MLVEDWRARRPRIPLSRAGHSWMLARLHRPRSWRLFSQAPGSDIADIQGDTTHEEVHLGAMAGTTGLMHHCYPSIKIRGGILRFHPNLPDHVRRLSMRLRYRGQVEFSAERPRGHLEPRRRRPILLGINDEVCPQHPGETREFSLYPVATS